MAQGRAKVRHHKISLQEDPFSTQWGRWPEGPDGVSATPRTFYKQDESRMGSSATPRTFYKQDESRMGSLPPLELYTSKMKAGWGLCHPSNSQQARGKAFGRIFKLLPRIIIKHIRIILIPRQSSFLQRMQHIMHNRFRRACVYPVPSNLWIIFQHHFL